MSWNKIIDMLILYLHKSHTFTFSKEMFFISIRGHPPACPVNSSGRAGGVVLPDQGIHPLSNRSPCVSVLDSQKWAWSNNGTLVIFSFSSLFFSLTINFVFCFVLVLAEKLFPSGGGNNWEFGFIVWSFNDLCTWINKL